MDELQMLETLGGQVPEPAREVADRHRQQLLTAMEATTAGAAGASAAASPGAADAASPSGAGDVADLHRPGRRGRPLVWVPARAAAAAVAVVVLMAGGVAVLQRNSGGADETVAAGEPSSGQPAGDPSAGGASPFSCGDDLPVDVVVPAGFEGPATGPGGDADPGPAPGQIVLHWESAEGIIEVRWPADPERSDRRDAFWDSGSDATAAGNVVTSDAEAAPVATGRMSKEMLAWLAAPPSKDCEAVQITVSATDAAGVDATSELIANHLFDRYLPPLVVGSSTADVPPKPGRCRSPAGMTVPPNRGGPVSSFGTYPTAEAALRAFVETQGTPGSPVPEPTLTRRGYQEITLPDGSVVYAYEPTPDFFTTAIHVVETDSGWTVADWEASGC